MFSLVVVTWNSDSEIRGLLTSLDRHLNGDYELIVVDNGSTDATVATVTSRRRGPSPIALEENTGFGHANNVGVRRASSDVVVLLNPDTLLIDDSLLDLVDLVRRTGAICGPELLDEDLSRQPSASPHPGGWEVWVDAFIPARVMPRTLRERCEPWRAAGVKRVGWLTGACLAAPRQMLLELGPFDEWIHLYGEDFDLGVRAAQAGESCLFAPGVARIVHLGDRSANQRFVDGGLALSVRNRRRVVRRRLGPTRDVSDFIAQVVFNVVRFVGKSVLRRSTDRERRWLRCAANLYVGTK
jgi:GT2 family glycosyltransferase